MRKKKRQVTLNIRLLGIQLLTLLPVFLLLIFVSYSMLRNLSGQIYDIRENEMNVVISRFDNEVHNIKADLSGLVEQYRGRMMGFRQDMGLMRFNELGYQCFIVNYRVAPYTLTESGLDMARAVRYARSNAEK